MANMATEAATIPRQGTAAAQVGAIPVTGEVAAIVTMINIKRKAR
jgi:hypothetical protein